MGSYSCFMAANTLMHASIWNMDFKNKPWEIFVQVMWKSQRARHIMITSLDKGIIYNCLTVQNNPAIFL